MLAGAGAAAKGHARARVAAHVAKDHGLHVDRGAPVVGDALVVAVGDGARAVPRIKHGLDRQVELLERVGRERFAKVALVHGLVLVHQALEALQADLGVRAHALARLDLVQRFLKVLARIVHHNVGKHGDKAAVGIIREPLVPGQLGQGGAGFVVQAQVEHGVHHARHGLARARAHRDQQRVGRVAEFLARLRLDVFERLQGLFPHPLGKLVRFHVFDARFGRDRERRRDGGASRRHGHQPCALAAELGLGLVQARLVPQFLSKHGHAIPCQEHPFLCHSYQYLLLGPELLRHTRKGTALVCSLSSSKDQVLPQRRSLVLTSLLQIVLPANGWTHNTTIIHS